MQYAWLECEKGFWRFSSGEPDEEKRKWVDESLALKELQEEGWVIAALYLEEREEQFRAYGLNRTVH